MEESKGSKEGKKKMVRKKEMEQKDSGKEGLKNENGRQREK